MRELLLLLLLAGALVVLVREAKPPAKASPEASPKIKANGKDGDVQINGPFEEGVLRP